MSLFAPAKMHSFKQVREGGAAADAGLTPGSRLVSLGSHSKANISTTATCSLADLKKSVQEAKARGDMSLQVTVQDPKAVARAASHLGQCKVEIAQMEASEAVAAAAEAEEKAAEEASKAAELYAANEGERHMEHARSHPNAFARDVLQVKMSLLFNEIKQRISSQSFVR
jgi:predicted metalloprotease with PDZ domain